MSVSRDALLDAVTKRLEALRVSQPTAALYTDHDNGHDLRQEIRKMIDRGIIENNKREVVLKSLEAIRKVVHNILANPKEEKYRRMKRSNTLVQELFIKPKGVLQLVVFMGFCEEAKNYETFFVYKSKSNDKLRVVATMIEEALARERDKHEEEETRREREDRERKEHLEKLHAQFIADRRAVRARVGIERLQMKEEPKAHPSKSDRANTQIATIHGSSQ